MSKNWHTPLLESLTPLAECTRETNAVAALTVRRIMLVIPGLLFRDGINSVLQRLDRVVTDSRESLDHAESTLDADTAPDLFVVGVPDGAREVFAQIRRLRARMPRARWIVLSRHIGPEFLRDAAETGVDGLLLEQDTSGEVLQLVAKLVFLGHSLVPPELARMLGEATPGGLADVPGSAIPVPGASQTGEPVVVPIEVSTGGGDRERAPAPFNASTRRSHVNLSDRETEILQCLVAGHSNKLIARDLHIAEATVKVHVKGLLRKMQVSNRTQAAIAALNLQNTPSRVDQPAVGATRTGVVLRAVENTTPRVASR